MDAVADLLLQRAEVFRVLGTPPQDFPVSDSGSTQRDYQPVPGADSVPCKVFLARPGSAAGQWTVTQTHYGLVSQVKTGGLFLLDAPIMTGDRLVVDGITYEIHFTRIVYDDGEASHLTTELERVVSAEPILMAGAV